MFDKLLLLLPLTQNLIIIDMYFPWKGTVFTNPRKRCHMWQQLDTTGHCVFQYTLEQDTTTLGTSEDCAQVQLQRRLPFSRSGAAGTGQAWSVWLPQGEAMHGDSRRLTLAGKRSPHLQPALLSGEVCCLLRAWIQDATPKTQAIPTQLLFPVGISNTAGGTLSVKGDCISLVFSIMETQLVFSSIQLMIGKGLRDVWMDPTFPLVVLHEKFLSSCFSSPSTSLWMTTWTLWHISHFSQLWVVCKIFERALCPAIQIINFSVSRHYAHPFPTPLDPAVWGFILVDMLGTMMSCQHLVSLPGEM